jgi:SAM-dependent methyltransferase
MVNFRFGSPCWRTISSLCSNTGSSSALESQMERPAWAPRNIDITVPSVSRIYDFYLGGSHNFEVDRQAARRVMEFVPGVPRIARANRAFLHRAVRFAAAEGVDQFLDIGSGIPASGNVHQVARAARPGARVVYVDHDPVAVAHSEAVLAGDDHAGVVAADLLKPRDILDSPQVERLIDLNRPVALLLVAILHFVDDADDPYGAVAELSDALAPGSLLVLTHASYEGMPLPPERTGRAVDVYQDIRNPLIMRSREEIARFFEGYDMVEPGLVPMPRWRPEAAPEDEDPYAFSGFAGVGRTA